MRQHRPLFSLFQTKIEALYQRFQNWRMAKGRDDHRASIIPTPST